MEDWLATLSDDMGQRITLHRAGLAFLQDQYNSGQYSRDSVRTARYTLVSLAKVVGPDRPVTKITQRDIKRWLAGGTMGTASQRSRIGTLRSFFKWCQVMGLHKGPSPLDGIRAPREPERMPRRLTAEEVNQLLKCADERETLIVLLMVQEGLRCGEIARLTLQDLDPDGRLLVNGKGGHQRVVPLTDQTIAAWHDYVHGGLIAPVIRSNQPGHYGDGVQPFYVSRLMQKLFKRAGIKTRPHDGKSGHALRHTCANDMLEHMKETGHQDLRKVQRVLGHKHLSTTSIYTRANFDADELRDAMGGRRYGRT